MEEWYWLEVCEYPEGDGEGDDGDGVAGEVDGGRVLAHGQVVRVNRLQAERRARTVIRVIGPRAVRQTHASRILCKMKNKL